MAYARIFTRFWLIGSLLISFASGWARNSSPPVDAAGRAVQTADGAPVNYDTAPTVSMKKMSSLLSAQTLNVTSAAPVAGSSQTPFWQYGVFGTNIGGSGIVIAQNGGVPEIYVSGAGYPNYFWQVLRRNAATGNYDQVWMSPVYTSVPHRIALGNVTGDSAQEIVVAFEDGTIIFYNQTTRAEVGRIATTSDLRDMRLADLDGDGSLEIVIVTSSDLKVYSKTGTLLWQVAGAGGTDLAIAQMDDDPGLEIATTSGNVVDVATHQIQWTHSGGFGAHLAAADVDGDGKAELIAADSWYYVYAYDVDRQLAQWSITTAQDIGAIAVANVDSDAAPELLIGDGQWGQIHAYNMATQTQKWQINNPNHGVTNIGVGDVDGDGALEVLWGAGATSSGADNLYIASAQTQALKWTSIALDGPFLSPAIGDLDGDGKLELVTCSFESESGYGSGRILVFDLATRTLRAISAPVSSNSAWTGVHDLRLRDVDGDGKPEILIGTDYLYDGVIEVYGFNADNTFTLKWTNPTPPSGMPFNQVDAADIDGDGQMEIIAGNYKEHTGAEGVFIHVYDYATKALEWRSANLTTSWSGIGRMIIGDFNGDSHLEIAAMVPDTKISVFDGVTHLQETEITGTFSALSINRAGASGFLTGNGSGALVLYTPVTSGSIPYQSGTAWTVGTERIGGITPGPANTLWVSLGGKLMRLDSPDGVAWTSADFGDYFGTDVVFKQTTTSWEVYAGTQQSVAGFLPPLTLTGSASSVTTNSASVRGSVNPLGVSSAAYFEYGTTTAFGNSTPATPSPVQGQTATQVSAALGNLQPHSNYYYRLVAPGIGDGGLGDTWVLTTSNSVPVAPNRTVHAPPIGQSSVIFDSALHATDADGDALGVTVSSISGSGSASAITSKQISYSNTVGFSGSVLVRVGVSDGFGGQVTSTVTVSNTAPAPSGDSFMVGLNANTLNVLGNDSDADGDVLKITAVTNPAHGTAAILTGGTAVSYDPVDTYVGSDSFVYTVADGVGGTKTATVSIQVPDTIAPTISGTFSPLTLATGTNGKATLPSYLAQAIATDNVAVTSKTQSPTAGTLVNAGTVGVTITASDAAKNSSSAQFNVVVTDATPPTIGGTFAPVALVTGSSGQAALPDYTSQAGAADNVGVNSIVQSPPGGTMVSVGVQNVTVTVTDTSGNKASKNFNVAVGDGTAPTIFGNFSPTVLTTGSDGSALLPDYTSLDTAADNVKVASLVQTPPGGTSVEVGKVNVVLTVSDATGNSASAVVAVDVRDGTPPLVKTRVPEQTLVAGADGTVKMPDFTSIVSATDNVGITSIVQDPPAGSVLTDGSHSLTFTVSDSAGNQTVVSTRVAVLLSVPLGDVIAYSGGPVPGVADAVFTQFGPPALDGSAPLFSARYKSKLNQLSTNALFFFHENEPVIVKLGDSAPGISGAKFTSFSEPIGNHGAAFLAKVRDLNDSQNSASKPSGKNSSAVVSGTGSAQQGLWTDAFSDSPGNWTLIAREGDAAPGTFGAVYGKIQSFALNDGPQLLWLAQLSHGTGAVNDQNDMALFVQSKGGAPTLLLREGQMLSVRGFLRVVKSILPMASPPKSSGDGRANGGDTAFLVTFVDGKKGIIYVGANESAQLVVFSSGQLEIPDLVEWQRLFIPAMVHDSAMVFRAEVGPIRSEPGVDNREGIFWNDDQGPVAMFLAGDPVPGMSGTTFQSLFDPVADARGDLAFRAQLSSADGKKIRGTALFSLPVGADKPVCIAQTGEAAPELPWTILNEFEAVALPMSAEPLRGPVFTAILDIGPGSVTAENRFVLCAVDRNGKARLLARTGTPMKIGGAIKTISKIAAFSALPTSPSQARTCGAEGRVIYRATFTDQSEALIVVKVP